METQSNLEPKKPPIWKRSAEALGDFRSLWSDVDIDPILFLAIVGLVGFGVVLVYSASAVYAQQKFGSSGHFFRRDVMWVTLGMVALWGGSKINMAWLRRYTYHLLLLSILLLAAVLVVGVRINGARRWFHFAGLSFQPAELAKLSMIFYLSYSLANKAEKIKTFTIGFVPHMLVCGVIMLLLLKQPDLGTAAILGLGTLILLFVAGTKISYIVLACLAAAPVLYQAIVGTPWRLKRMLAYIDPWQYRYDIGYQITESLISLGSGGSTGLGLGQGRQKLFFLPEAHTDYIMAIVGEELGWVGVSLVIFTLCVVLWRGSVIAIRAVDPFCCYAAYGITILFALQALVNFGVVLGALPTKGLPMPFVSFGGSTLLVDLFAAGILLNISRTGSIEESEPRKSRLMQRLLPRSSNRRVRSDRPRIFVENATR